MKDVKGYEGLYAITEDGRVWGYKRSRYVKPYLRPDGYLQIILHKNGCAKTHKIHRLVAETYIDNPDNLSQINHKDEDKLNNHINNLEWCDAKYNSNYGTRNIRGGQSRQGKTFSEEHKKKISDALSGRTLSVETKQKISNMRKGSHLSDEHKAKLSRANKGKGAKAVRCVETNAVYSSATEAENKLGISRTHIGSCCQGNRQTAGGYHWEYFDEMYERREFFE